ncbi:MAG: XapX domain-containing protein [Rhodanobacter sp.]
MKSYLLSLIAGLLVGVVYALIRVRSPAPPVIALVGLLGILIGEQIPPLVKQVLGRQTTATVWMGQQVKPHVFGELPCGKLPTGAITDNTSPNNMPSNNMPSNSRPPASTSSDNTPSDKREQS